MIAWLGSALLHLATIAAFYSAVMSFVGASTGRRLLEKSARAAAHGTTLLAVICSAFLLTALLAGHYQIEYVFSYSSSDTPLLYKISALWAGQDGSLLFWALVLTLYTSLVIRRERNPGLMPYVTGTLMTVAFFFFLAITLTADPFRTLPFTPPDGRGLNPILQNFYMAVHPPALYLGFVGMAVPFAFAVAALLSGRLDEGWLPPVRRWTLIAWFFLSVGNLLGASWAYEVLGWGGYWAWDPVENAALIPWLTSTALLHSILVQEKRGLMKSWNMALVVLSFLLTIVGTFITRSGVISSVHAFAQSNIGTYFLVFLAVCLASSVFLMILRSKQLGGGEMPDSWLSREGLFLLNNLVFVGAAFAVLWGTVLPALSEWLTGSKIAVGPPYYRAVMVPTGLLLLLLTGVGPLMSWRRSSAIQVRRNVRWPLAAAALTLFLTLVFTRSLPVLVTLPLCAFVLAGVVAELVRGATTRRFGGYMVHAGVALLFVGFAGAALNVEHEMDLRSGESASVGRYRVRYDGLDASEEGHRQAVRARLTVSRPGMTDLEMSPARVFYTSRFSGEMPPSDSRVAIRRTLREDLYLVLLNFDPRENRVWLKAMVNPLIQFVWLGGIVLILGTLLVMWPAREARARSLAGPTGGCPRCGHPPRPEDRFCGQCGSAVSACVFLLCLLSAWPAWAASRGEIRGRVWDEAGGKRRPASGVVVRMSISREDQPVAAAQAKTGTDGTYRFMDLDPSTAFSYEAKAFRGDIPYRLAPVRFQGKAVLTLEDIVLLPATGDPAGLAAKEIFLLDWAGTNLLKITESVVLENRGRETYDPRVVGARPLELPLLPGAFQLRLSGGLPEEAAETLTDRNLLRLLTPVPPGPFRLEFSYLLEYAGRELVLESVWPVRRSEVVVAVANRDLPVRANGLAKEPPRRQEDTVFYLHSGGPFPAGEKLRVTISGLPVPGAWGRRVLWFSLSVILAAGIFLGLRKPREAAA